MNLAAPGRGYPGRVLKRLGEIALLAALAAPAHAAAAEKENESLRGYSEHAVAVPGGMVTVSPSRFAAGRPGQRIGFAVAVGRARPGSQLLLTLPARWVTLPSSGLRAVRGPRLVAGDDLDRDGRTIALALGRDARAAFELVDNGIPAGSYELPVRWRTPGGEIQAAPPLRVSFRAPERESEPDPVFGRLESNVTNDSTEESETYVAVAPNDRDRVLVGSNWHAAGMAAWVTSNAGQSWSPARQLPQTTLKPSGLVGEGNVCCDPMAAADELGSIWYGGIACIEGPDFDSCLTEPSSWVVVARIPAGSDNYAQSTTTALKQLPGTEVDKPMMTIDRVSGRLYVVWNAQEPNGGVKVVISQCDTEPTASECDDPTKWSDPVVVSGASFGSFIYASVAAGPDGRVYVTWWDYSNNNRIAGVSCSADCHTAGGWSVAQTIALLDSTGGQPIPFECPIVAQPGGRVGPAPYVAVDRSGGAQNGRVYVSWGDLRPGGQRCAGALFPTTSLQNWDVFVGSAAGALPGGAGQSSTQAGTRLVRDDEGGSGADDWFAGLAVDHDDGQAYAGFYSTRDDATRRTAHFYYRAVGPQGGSGASLSGLAQLSNAASNYASTSCCDFRDDYGDYTQVAAAAETVWPVWTDNSGGDGEVFTFTPGAFFRPAVTTAAVEDGGADGDGRIEPGEPYRVHVPIVNAGTVGATGVGATVAAPGGLSASPASIDYGNLGPAGESAGSADVVGAVDPGVACGENPAVTLNVAGTRADTSTAASNQVQLPVPVRCDPPAPVPPTTTTPPAPVPPTTADTTAPRVVIGRIRTVRLTRRGSFGFPLGPFDENVTGTISYSTASRVRPRRGARPRVLRLGTVSYTAALNRAVRVTRRLTTSNFRIVRRLRRVRVTATVTARDQARNSARQRVTFTLLAPRR